jgi:hypothetical protein
VRDTDKSVITLRLLKAVTMAPPAGSGAPGSCTRLNLTERAILFEMFVKQEVYLKNGADLDATLSRVAKDICEPQDAVTKLTSSFFRVAVV